ncbi:MAG: hypothetical protein GC200_09185 [Tepidisphaera sp.]|nr:hypothetical protein [Tepidisphaera sp.]
MLGRFDLRIRIGFSVCSLAALGLTGATPVESRAQDQPAAAFAPGADVDPQIAAALAAVRTAYSLPGITERESVTLRPLQGPPRTSRLSVLIDRGDGSLLHPPRAVIKLGVQLHIEAVGEQFRAVNQQNKQLLFEAKLPGGVSPESLGKIIPALPLPQLAWAFSPDAAPAGATLRVDPLGVVTWIRADRRPGETVLQGTSPRGPVEMVIDSGTGRLLRLSAAMGEDGTRLEIRTEPAEPADDRGWAIDPVGRTRVGSMSELREAPAAAQLGARAPGLGLMTPSLAAWDLSGSLREMLLSPTQAGSGPAYIALVLYRATGADAGADATTEAALQATFALRAIKKDLDRRRQQGEASEIRLLVRPVAVLELTDVQPSRIKSIEEPWTRVGEDLLWTSGGQALLDRFAPQSAGVVVLIDPEQTLLGRVTIDPANQDADAVASQFRAILKDLALPEPESPATPDVPEELRPPPPGDLTPPPPK